MTRRWWRDLSHRSRGGRHGSKTIAIEHEDPFVAAVKLASSEAARLLAAALGSLHGGGWTHDTGFAPP